MKKTIHITAVVLVLLCALCNTGGQNTSCTSGTACFPARMVPDDVSNVFCCPEKNTTRHEFNQTDGSKGCVCMPDFSLDEKIQSWAKNTMNQGRMCSHGVICENVTPGAIVSSMFEYCCPNSHSLINITIIDGDKKEYIGCRCSDVSLPTVPSNDYAVPPTQHYSSSGERCLYNEACNENPAAQCNSSSVTFCCYGSRGIFTSNEGASSLTRCTCTNEFYGARCEAFPVPIEHTTMPCLTECDKVTDDQGSSKCCPYNMVVNAEPTSCFCKVETSSTVSPVGSLFHVIIATTAVWYWSRLGLM